MRCTFPPKPPSLMPGASQLVSRRHCSTCTKLDGFMETSSPPTPSLMSKGRPRVSVFRLAERVGEMVPLSVWPQRSSPAVMKAASSCWMATLAPLTCPDYYHPSAHCARAVCGMRSRMQQGLNPPNAQAPATFIRCCSHGRGHCAFRGS